jgi:hypothetical protein
MLSSADSDAEVRAQETARPLWLLVQRIQMILIFGNFIEFKRVFPRPIRFKLLRLEAASCNSSAGFSFRFEIGVSISASLLAVCPLEMTMLLLTSVL